MGLQNAGEALPVWPAHQLCCSSEEMSVRKPIEASLQRRREKKIPDRFAIEFEMKGKTEERTKWRESERRRI